MPGENDKKKPKILIVEDELIVATNIENQLSKMGYEVFASVDSGEEAIRLAQEAKPDLALMDIKLTGSMDGIEAAQHLYEHLHIPVVFLTAYMDNDTLQRAKTASPYGYILKPFDINKLYTTIEIALHKHQIEKKLKESEQRFRTLADDSPVGIFQTDINGNCNYVNRRWCEITGLSPTTAARECWNNALHQDDRAAVREAWDQMNRPGGRFAMEYRFQTPGGKINWVFGHAVPIKDNPAENTGYIGIITDITAKKKLEKKLSTAEKLEAIGILAGGIAHDFNNLLSVIIGNISMLRDDLNITPTQTNMLKKMEKASFQAADLAQKLITFSKGGWLHREKVIFPHLLEEVIFETFPTQQTYFDLRVPPDLHPIDGDPGQLKQVLVNLLYNAVEAESETKIITITAQNIENAPEDTPLKKGRYVKITIEDRGIGIPQEYLGKVFDPYFSTKSRGTGKGMGLGLTICYSIIQKHDGHIHIGSLPGKGTKVKVYLPTFQAETPYISDRQVILSPPHPTVSKVLVMDDDPAIQDVTRKLLERISFTAETFDEGQQALEAYKNAWEAGQPYDVVILDLINKKGLGGKETLKKILQLNSRARVVAICGFSNGTEREDLLQEGFSDVLLKPYKMSDLKSTLDRLEVNTN